MKTSPLRVKFIEILRFLFVFPVVFIIRLIFKLRRTVNFSAPKAIVLFRPDSLGDSFLLSDVCHELKKLHPDMKIVVFGTYRNREFYLKQPAVDHFIEIELLNEIEARWGPASIFFLVLKSALLFIKTTHVVPELFVGLDGMLREAALGYALNATKNINLDAPYSVPDPNFSYIRKLRLGRWSRYLTPSLLLTRSISFNKAYRYNIIWTALGALGAKLDQPYLKNLRKTPHHHENYLLIAPQAAHQLRNIPLVTLEKTFGALAAKGKYELRFLGTDSAYLNEASDLAKRFGFATSINTSVDINEGLAIVDSAKFVIATDSAWLHAAFLFSKRTIGFFGPGDQTIWAPQSSNTRILSRNLECSPCENRCIFETNICLTDLSVEEIQKAVDWLVS